MYEQNDNTLKYRSTMPLYLLFLDEFIDTNSFSTSSWSSSLLLAAFRFLRDDLIVGEAPAPAAGEIAPASRDLSAIAPSCCVSVAVNLSAGGDF